MPEPFRTTKLDPSLDIIDALRRFDDCEQPVVFHSAATHRAEDARYSFLTADPIRTFRIDTARYGECPLSELRHWQTLLPKIDQQQPPFRGGIAGLMSYELGHAFERLPGGKQDDFQTPALLAGLYDWAIVWDHLQSTVQLHAISLNRGDPIKRTDWALQRLQNSPTRTEQKAVDVVSLKEQHCLPGIEGVVSTFSREEYLTAVERVIEYIRAGDIFQANLSQQLRARWHGNATDLLARVCKHNPAPFAGMIQAADFSVISASPERFLKVNRERQIETRPIKGTRRRQRSPIADLYTGHELSTSEKDRAENVMIVDLLRNDISRVCDPGSVKVTGLCEIELFETVQHLVSTVVGTLSHDKDIWDLCAAAVPGGSITGAPKIRAMQIIADLEPVVRGAYCGNLFYAGPNGDFDSSILIRSFTLKDGVVEFPAGGGIVADSDPVAEYEETLHKAAGMLSTLQTNAPVTATKRQN